MSKYSQFSDEELRQQAAANSAAWHGADANTQNALHDANVEIHAELDRRSGNTSTFDSTSGTWTSQEENGVAGDPNNGAAAWRNGGYDDRGNVDYSVQIRNLMNAGSTDADTLQALLNARQKKAQGTPYDNDSFAQETKNYINSIGAAQRTGTAQARDRQTQQTQMQELLRQQQEALKQERASQLAQALEKLKYAYDENLREYQAGENDLERLYRENVAQYENRRDQIRAAYERNLAGYQDSSSRLGQTYDAARNRAAAQSAQSQRAFDERAAAMGLGTGTTGQAALSREAALQSALSGIDQAQANAQADIDLRVQNLGTELSQQESDLDLQLAKLAAQYGFSQSELKRAIQDLTSRYEIARAEAQNSSQAEIAQALYEELLRQGQYNRADQQQAQAWEREDQLRQEQWQRQDAQQTQADARDRIDTYLRAGGTSAQLDPALISQSGYTQAELNALEAYYRGQTAASTPTTVLDTMRSLGNDAAAYAYLVGKGYNKDATATLWNYYKSGQTGTGTETNPNALISNPTPSPRLTYNNGGLDSEQVKQLQTYFGLTPDGYWGPNSQKTTRMTADQAWEVMLSRNAEMESDRVPFILNRNDDGGVYVDGLGKVTYTDLEEAVNSGRVKETEKNGIYTYTLTR